MSIVPISFYLLIGKYYLAVPDGKVPKSDNSFKLTFSYTIMPTTLDTTKCNLSTDLQLCHLENLQMFVCLGFLELGVFFGGGGRVDIGLLEQIIKLVTFRENFG